MIAKSAKTWHIHDMHTRDTLTKRVLESKGVKCIEERPSLEGHKSKGVKCIEERPLLAVQYSMIML